MASPAAILEIWVNAQTGAASGKLTKFNSQMKASEIQADRSSKAIGGKLAKGMKLVGIAAAAGAAYGLYKAVEAGATFERQMDSLGAVTGANVKQMKRLEQQALDFGESSQYTANQVAEAQIELAKGGLNVAQIYGGALKASLGLAAAGELELATAAETTVNAMKLFGLQGKDSVQIADMLATAANRTTADVTDFAMALRQGGSVAKLAGLDLNNTVTILEALAESGIKNSDAGTSMKTAMIQLLKPTKKQAKLAEELGIIWTTQNGTIKTAAGLSKELRSATNGMTKAERAKTLATLAGTDGVRTLNALYEAGPAKLQKLEQANRKQGTAQEIARQKMDNLKGDWEQFTGALETAEIKLYKVLKGPLRTTTQWLTGAVQAVSNFDFAHAAEEAELFVTKLHEMGNVSFAGLDFNVFDTYWAAAKKEVDIFAAYLKALPGIATAVFGAVASAERWVVRASEDLAEWVGRAYRNVVGFVGSLIPFKVALLAVKLAIAPVVGLMMGLFKAAKILSPIIVAAANNFKSVWVAAMKVSLAILQVFLKFIGNVGAVVGDVVGLVSNLLRGNWGGAWKNAKQLFVDVWHTIVDLLKGGWTVIKTLFSAGTKAMGQVLGNSVGALGQVANNIGNALKGAFSSAWDKIEGIFTTGANAVIDVVNTVIDVINAIPGPNIGKVGHVGGGGEGKGHHRQHKQSGGMIVPGTGSGDKFRTALPPGSFILNRKATAALGFAAGGMMPVALEPGEKVFLPREVKAMGGARKLEAMNRKVPRFQAGGEVPSFGIGGIVEDAVNTVSPVAGKVAGKAVDALSNVAGKGASYFIGKLPKPDLPEPFAALGPHIIARAAEYIKSGFKSKKLGSVSIAPGALGYAGPPANMKQLGDNRYVDSHTLAVTALVDKMFGLTMTDGYRDAATAEKYPSGLGTLHHDGTPSNPGATDSAGPMGAMQAALAWSKRHIAGLQEAQIDNVAGWNMHLGFFANGGLLQRLAEGGFAGRGYTVKGSAASDQQMHTAREIMEAADKTGASHLPRVASMMAATQESAMGATGNTFQLTGDFEGVSPSDRAYKQAVQWFTKGYYHGGGIGLSKKLSDPGAIAQEVEGSAYPDAYDPWKSEGQKWTDGWGKGAAGGEDEKVKAVYHGARTGSLSFGPVPKSLPGIEKELRARRREVGQYRAAADRAGKEGKPKTQHAITVNITALETRIHELERARTKERQEAAKRKTSRRFAKALGALTGFEPLIAAKERAFDGQQQFVEQLVALEPLAPELPGSATNAQRAEAEKTYVSQFSTYVEAQEKPAYQSLLGLAGDWRNTILRAQQKAAGPWQTAKTLGGLEGNWEDRIIAVSNEIDRISSLPKEHTAKYWKENPKAYEHMQEQLDKLPMLRFTDSELRKVLGEGREKFFPGKARVRDPIPPFPGSGSFEDALSTVQGTHFPGMHEMLASLPGQRVAGMFGGAVWDVQTSLAELGLKVAGARSSLGGEGEASVDESERVGLLEEQLRQANQRNLVFERQKPIIDAYEASHPALSSFAGMYAKGGSIPAGMWGIAGERGPEPVVGPATVVSNPDAQSMFGGSPKVLVQVFEGDARKTKVYVDEKQIEAVVKKVNRRDGRGAQSIGARRAGRGMA